MPRNLHRYYGNGDLHFITCSCYQRRKLLATGKRRDLFLDLLEQTRNSYAFVVLGYVVMPEHFHLLISEPQSGTPSTVMQVLKQRFAHKVLSSQRRARASGQGHFWPDAEELHVWQQRFYDFNVWTGHKRAEKLRYMHLNPVKRGLVNEPENWAWSSFRDYFCQRKGRVRVNDSGTLKLHIRELAV